jgi:hypothetical protein
MRHGGKRHGGKRHAGRHLHPPSPLTWHRTPPALLLLLLRATLLLPPQTLTAATAAFKPGRETVLHTTEDTLQAACNCVNNTLGGLNTTNREFVTLTTVRRSGNLSSLAFLTCNNSLGVTKYNVSWKVYKNLTLSNATTNATGGGPTNFSGWTPNCTNYLNTTEDLTSLEQFTMKRPINLSHVIVAALLLGSTFCLHSCCRVSRYAHESNSIRSLPRLKSLLGAAMFAKKGVFSNTVSESKRRAQLDKALIQNAGVRPFAHLGAMVEPRHDGATITTQTVRQYVEYSHVALENAVFDSGRVPKRRIGESVRSYLLDTVSKEIGTAQQAQYRDRVRSYVRLYERARYGRDTLTQEDLERVREEVLFVKGMF